MNDMTKIEVRKYRKKPLVIEAVQMPIVDDTTSDMGRLEAMGQNALIAEWIVQNGGEVKDYGPTFLEVVTLEGVMTGGPGDYIIRGIKGEFYPHDGSFFLDAYEAPDAATGDLRDEQIERLRNALLDVGVQPGIIDLIQKGQPQ